MCRLSMLLLHALGQFPIILLTTLALGISTWHYGQNTPAERVFSLERSNTNFESVDLIQSHDVMYGSPLRQYGIDPAHLSQAMVLRMRSTEVQSLLAQNPSYITFEIPIAQDEVWSVKLFRESVLTDDFAILSPTGFRMEALPIFYRGSVNGREGSLVALTVTAGEIRGMFSAEGNTYTLGALLGTGSDLHVLYRNDHFQPEAEFSCTPLEPEGYVDQDWPAGPKNNKCVKVKAELDFSLINHLGGVQQTVIYAMGLFNEVSTLYAASDVNLVLSEIQTWENGSPYSGGPLDYITQMTNNSPNANLTTMLSRNGGGGIAYVSTVCSTNFGVSYNGVFGTYNALPAYSWDLMVVAHELGHNLSSKHTHSCSWNGNNTALDGCGPTAGYSEGCTAPLPTGGGTIMSYCHLIGSVGINLSNGFGPQPGTRIRNYVNNASCLGTNCLGIGQEPANCDYINFSNFSLQTYAPGVQSGPSQTGNGGTVLHLQSNAGRSIDLNYTITPATVLEFEFRSTEVAQVHGIGFDNDNVLSPERIFRLYGTGVINQVINSFNNYTGTTWRQYSISVGTFYTGSNLSKLFFLVGNVNGTPGGNASFRNIRVFENGECQPAPTTGSAPLIADNASAAASRLRLYPNPASDGFELNIEGWSDEGTIRLISLSGKIEWSQYINSPRTWLDTRSLGAGVYIAEFQSRDGRVQREKIILVR